MNLLLVPLLLASAPLAAAPFLTADPQCFDPTGANGACPAGYEYSQDAGATWQPLDAQIEDEQITLYADLGGMSNGLHAWQVRGTNAWGTSDSVPFDFVVGAPVPPGGLRLVLP